MATSLTRNGNFISVYPRAVPRRRGDAGQRGGAWNVTNKARNFLEAGLTAAEVREEWRRVQGDGGAVVAKDEFLRWLLSKGAIPSFASGNTIDVPTAEIAAVAQRMEELQARTSEEPASKPSSYWDSVTSFLGTRHGGIAGYDDESEAGSDGDFAPYDDDRTSVGSDDSFRSALGDSSRGAPGPSAPPASALADIPVASAPPASALADIPVASAPTADQVAGIPMPPLAVVTAGLSTVAASQGELEGASPMDKVKLLEVFQMDPNLQALVRAGLFKWDDVLKANDGSVVLPDGSRPTKIIDQNKLSTLRNTLQTVSTRMESVALEQVQIREQRRATPGPKTSRADGFFPGVNVYMPPRYLPGRLPNPQNSVLV
eukprot:COSAG06_NODE_107_length_23726_cov_104.636148_4_plen_373_part_00